MSAAFATLVALEQRHDTGRGCFVEVSMVESALNAAAEQVIEYTAHGTVLSRIGNRSRDAAPQGLYACRGEEQWLAVSVATDAQWEGLKAALGHPAWAGAEELAHAEGRRRAHDAIDEALSAWAAAVERDDAVELLIAHRVPAAPAHDPRTIASHPQFVARRHFEVTNHPIIGPLRVPAPPFKFAGVDRWVRSPAPTLGQHNAEVLSGELGLDADAVEDLVTKQVIGTTPTGLP